MNSKDDIISMPLRPTHGTAKQVAILSIVPRDKKRKEVFWVKQLLNKIQKPCKKVYSNVDDSYGSHDVVIDFDMHKTGVQVTELTYELERARIAIRQRYLGEIIKELFMKKIKSEDKILIEVFFPIKNSKSPTSARSQEVAMAIIDAVENYISNKTIETPFGKLLIQKIKSEKFYVPNFGNIGVDVNFDQMPRSLAFYKEAVDSIVAKKTKSKSSWLLIWSLDFWKDKNRLGKEITRYMRESFTTTSFDKVYFVKSLDGDGLFQTNLKIEEIK